MAQAVTKSRETVRFTYDDYLLLSDDGKRYEIIEGDLFMTPAPVPRHQIVVTELGKRLADFVSANTLGIVLFAPGDVVLSKTNVVQPDILFVSKGNGHIVKAKNIQGAPDLLVEVASRNTRKRDLVLKKKLYAKFGVKEYWIIHTEEEQVEVWRLQDSAYALDGTYQKTEQLKSPLLPGLRINLTEVFREIEDYF